MAVSRQLLQMAERVSRAYETLPGLSMSLVTGSVARGLADASSDLDIYLYWHQLDVAALDSQGHAEGAIGDRLFGVPTATGFFEKYQSGGRLVDVESVTIEALEGVAVSLGRREPMSPLVAKTMAGLRDAVPLLGAEHLETWRSRLTYSPEQALVEVSAHLRQFLPPLVIYDLTAARGDIISYSARLSAIALAAIGAIAGVNRYALALEDPKWLPWHVAQFAIKPADFVHRLQAPFASPGRPALLEFTSALTDSLDLVETEMPVARSEVQRARFVLAFPPEPGSRSTSGGSPRV